jgi:hypothetical protein
MYIITASQAINDAAGMTWFLPVSNVTADTEGNGSVKTESPRSVTLWLFWIETTIRARIICQTLYHDSVCIEEKHEFSYKISGHYLSSCL